MLKFTIHAPVISADQYKELDRKLYAFVNRFDFGVSYRMSKAARGYDVAFEFEQDVTTAQQRAEKIINRACSR